MGVVVEGRGRTVWGVMWRCRVVLEFKIKKRRKKLQEEEKRSVERGRVWDGGIVCVSRGRPVGKKHNHAF